MSEQTFPSQYVSANQIRKIFDVSVVSLRRWAEQGKIDIVRTPGGKKKRLYRVDSVKRALGITLETHTDPTPSQQHQQQQRQCICYARVSSQKQAEDLQRQVQDLRKAFPNHTIISDIGSGLNFTTRKGFLSLLDRALNGDLEEVVVMHKDRLCRFGIELVEHIFNRSGTKLVVYGASEDLNGINSSGDDEHAYNAELAEDLMSIITVFVARHNGRRSAENKKRRRAEGEQNKATQLSRGDKKAEQ
jgi:putative resolvase